MMVNTSPEFWLNIQKRWDAVIEAKRNIPKYYHYHDGYSAPFDNWVSKDGFVKIQDR